MIGHVAGFGALRINGVSQAASMMHDNINLQSQLMSNIKLRDSVNISAEGKAMATAFAEAQEAQGKQKITFNDFEQEMGSRLYDASKVNNSNGSINTSGEHDMLVKSLSASIKALEESYGEEYAQEAMAGILGATEDGNISVGSIVGGLSAVMEKVSTDIMFGDSSGNHVEFMKSLIKDDSYLFACHKDEADHVVADNERALGLGYALNRYFGLNVEESEDGLMAKAHTFQNIGLGDSFQEALISDSITSGIDQIIAAPPDALKGSVIAPEVIESFSNFIGQLVGDEHAAADIFEKLTNSSDFMTTATEVIGSIYEKYGADTAAKIVGYMNDNMRDSLTAAANIGRSNIGQTELLALQFIDVDEMHKEASLSQMWKGKDNGGGVGGWNISLKTGKQV